MRYEVIEMLDLLFRKKLLRSSYKFHFKDNELWSPVNTLDKECIYQDFKKDLCAYKIKAIGKMYSVQTSPYTSYTIDSDGESRNVNFMPWVYQFKKQTHILISGLTLEEIGTFHSIINDLKKKSVKDLEVAL